MPELPEVETVALGLQGPLIGRAFIRVNVLWPNSVRPSVEALTRRLPGQKIEDITRRAKYLQFHLSGEETLFIHLKMSGSLLVEPAAESPHRYVRVIFGLDNGYELRFKDMRKFGRVHLVENPNDVVGNLGPEPLADDFTVDDFKALFAGRRGRLKPLLLNQQFIAGIGNIYADESLYMAGIHPARPANTLSDDVLTCLYHAIQNVLRQGIMLKGASFDAVYRGGEYQNHFQVYGRRGKPCRRCKTPIERIVLGGRSTHFCPVCQSQS